MAKDDLKRAIMNEFSMISDNAETRQAMRDLKRFVDMMVEEGWSRKDAIEFLANSTRPQ